jgi:hypothetical protein
VIYNYEIRVKSPIALHESPGRAGDVTDSGEPVFYLSAPAGLGGQRGVVAQAVAV